MWSSVLHLKETKVNQLRYHLFSFHLFSFCVCIDAKLRSQAAGSFFKFLGWYHKSNIDLVYCPRKLFCPWTPYVVSVGRLEEREVELKKEYNSLHQRHTEVRKDWGEEKKESFQLYLFYSLLSSGVLLWHLQMIHNYMEHVERIKLQQFNETSETSTVGRVRSVGDKIQFKRDFCKWVSCVCGHLI